MFPEKKIISLSFSDISLKAVLIHPNGSKKRIIFSQKHRLPEGIVFDEKIVDMDRFKEEVRNFLHFNKDSFKTNKVVFSLNEQEVYFTALKKDSDLSSKGLQNALEPLLPFNFNEALLTYLKRDQFTQVVAARRNLISDLNSIFDSSEFELLSLVPVPSPILNLLVKEKAPYLFLLSEDQTIVFALVIAGTIVFSSSLKLIKTLESSKKEIENTVKKIIEVEYPLYKKEGSSLKKVFLAGSQVKQIKEILQTSELELSFIELAEHFNSNDTADFENFTKAVLTTLSFNNSLNFKPETASKTSTNRKERKLPSLLVRLLLIAGVILLVLFILFGLFVLLRNNFQKASKPQEKETSQTKAIIVSTKSASTQPVVPPPTLNKQDYSVVVLNGTNTPHLASGAKDFLTSQGYSVVSTGNADNTNYEQTTLQVKASKQAIVADLTSTLKQRYSLIVGSNLEESATSDVIIILGRN
ncbi:MAG TPA: LytR C-terminal domain-containing protein [Candidatus Saccharimonadales bacterium]|nr:LytR C-terminal domain-containing protein [Candidatus Saccharimonadales bacterium]